MISASGISKSTPFLSDIKIELIPGAMTGIIGPNGAGKTSLLKILAGLIKPDAGVVRLNDQPISVLSRKNFATQVAYLEQNSFVHWPLSVKQLIMLGRFPHRDDPDNNATLDESIVEAVANDVGVSKLMQKSFNTLSGGERARVLLARAIAVQADYLLADEPIAALDLKYQFEIMNKMKSMANKGVGVCVILHDLSLAANYCDRIYLMDKGKIITHGKAASVITEQNLARVFCINATIARVNDRLQIHPQPL